MFDVQHTTRQETRPCNDYIEAVSQSVVEYPEISTSRCG